MPASLLVRIAGVDQQAHIRRGDVSATGIYVELSVDIGALGTIHALQIAMPDASERVQLLGRLVRILSVEDLAHGKRTMGAAFEFMFTSEKRRTQVQALMRALTEAGRDTQLAVNHAFEGTMQRSDGQQRDVVVYSLTLNDMTLETTWPVFPGEVIECAVRSPKSGREFRFSGKVVEAVSSSEEADIRYRVNVRFRAPPVAEATIGASIGDAISCLLDESVAPVSAARPLSSDGGMRGNTKHVPLQSILSFAEMERMTGVIHLSARDNGGRIYVDGGRVIDALLERNQQQPRDDLSVMLGWDQAMFQLKTQTIDRPARLHTSTTALLLELAKLADEQSR